MFFNPELLTKKKGVGAFGVIWLAATLGPRSHYKKLSKKEVVSVDIPGACTYLQAPPEPMALRLTSNLVVGLARVYHQQTNFYYADVQNTYTKVKRSFLSLTEDEINMAVVEAKYDAITLELEDELRLDQEFRPPKQPGSTKKAGPNKELMVINYDFLMNPENSLSQDSSLAPSRRNLLPGTDAQSVGKSSFRGNLAFGAAEGFDNSTNQDAFSVGLAPGSVRRSLGLREGSAERSVEGKDADDLLAQNEDMLLNDDGFDLFGAGAGFGELDLAAMVDAEHAAAKQVRKRRRPRADGKEGEEEEEEEEEEDKENRSAANNQDLDLIAGTEQNNQLNNNDDFHNHIDSNGFFDTQIRQGFNADGPLETQDLEEVQQGNVNKRAKKKKRLTLVLKADEKIELTNTELLGHIKGNGGDIARFLVDDASNEVALKERQKEQNAELKVVLAALPFQVAPELRTLWDDYIVKPRDAEEYEIMLLAPQAKRKRAKKAAEAEEGNKKRKAADPEQEQEQPLFQPFDDNNQGYFPQDDFIPDVENPRHNSSIPSLATPLRQQLWDKNSSNQSASSKHTQNKSLLGDLGNAAIEWSAAGGSISSGRPSLFGGVGSMMMEMGEGDTGIEQDLFNEDQIRAAQQTSLEREQTNLFNYIKDCIRLSDQNHVYFDTIVVPKISNRAMAANMFFYMLAMTTRDVLKVAQPEPFGEIKIEIKGQL